MARTPRISILLHELSAYGVSQRPLIWFLAEAWKKSGIEISILKGISHDVPDTDLLIPHIDLTVTPPDYVEFIDRFPNVINRRLTDISKRVISAYLVTQDDPYAGKVIVKTNMNYGGIPELIYDDLAGRGGLDIGSIQRPWRKVDHLDPENYPIFGSIQEVPTGVWRNSNLVVEKFMPETEDGFF